jgi:hypothetical protein
MIRSHGTVLAAGMALMIAACAPAPESAAEEEAVAVTPESYAPSIEGTYRLVARELPDGTRQEPPAVEGLITYTRRFRNFNIIWHDADGNPFSIGYIARYSLTDTEYSETSVYRLVNDQISGARLSYDLSGPSGASPITVTDGSIAFTLPLYGEPDVVYTADGITAWREGEFVDYWEKVE